MYYKIVSMLLCTQVLIAVTEKTSHTKKINHNTIIDEEEVRLIRIRLLGCNSAQHREVIRKQNQLLINRILVEKDQPKKIILRLVGKKFFPLSDRETTNWLNAAFRWYTWPRSIKK